jgi:hypothetical protein
MRITTALVFCATAIIHTSASAWFIFIPGGLITAAVDKAQGVEGDHCVNVLARVGDKISLPGGRSGTIRSLSGTSSRCANPSIPIRARLDLDDWSALRPGEQQTVCVPHGLRAGDRYSDLALGNVIIQELAVTATQCTDAKLPVQAKVISAVALPAPPPVKPPPPAAPPIIVAPLPVSTQAPSEPAKQQTAPTESSSTAQKLRELNGLLKDGVINQQDYDAKKQELLKSF